MRRIPQFHVGFKAASFRQLTYKHTMAGKKKTKKGGNSSSEVILEILQNVDPEDIKKGFEVVGGVVKGVAGIFKKKKEVNAGEDEESEVTPSEE